MRRLAPLLLLLFSYSLPAIYLYRPKPQMSAERVELTITSNPSGAGVKINGIPLGSTPVTVSLVEIANFKPTVKQDGYLPWQTQLVAVSGRHMLNAVLSKVVVFQEARS